MGTFVIFILLCIVIGFIIRSMIANKKAGKSSICGCDCKNCTGHCHGGVSKE